MWLSLRIAEATDDEDVGIRSLRRGSLERDVVLGPGPLELLLAEALELEVKEENLRRVWLNIIDRILVFVSISGAN